LDAQTGIITTVAGSGKRDSSGDGGSALEAGLEYPNSVAVDTDGNLFIAQYGNGRDSHRIRRVDAKTGVITTVAGVAKAGLIGDVGVPFGESGILIASVVRSKGRPLPGRRWERSSAMHRRENTNHKDGGWVCQGLQRR
jgi:hypothetical protein